MQWLSLEARFVEPLNLTEHPNDMNKERWWIEFQKVGEIVEEMRRAHVVEIQITSFH